MARSGIVLPLAHARHRVVRRRGSGRPRGRRVRLSLLVLAVVLTGSVAFVLWAYLTRDDFPIDGLSTSTFGLDLGSSETNSDPSAVSLLRISTSPASATLGVDGATKGRTPLDMRVAPGSHLIAIHHPDAVDESRSIDVGSEGVDLNVALWRRSPKVTLVLPPFPGANLLDAHFLQDGAVALLVGLPMNSSAINPLPARELWRLDPDSGDLSRVMLQGDRELRPPVLTLAPDGSRLAYVGPTPGSSAAKTSQAVWVSAGPGEPATLVYTPAEREARITDLAWDPQSRRLIVAKQLAPDPPRTEIILLDTTVPQSSTAETLITVPVTVVPGSESWDRQSRWMSFLSRARSSSGATRVSLNAVEARPEGSFRYIADLGSPQPLPAAPGFAWDPADVGRAVFVAPIPDAAKSPGPLDLFASLRSVAPPLGMFTTSIGASADASPRRLGSSTGLSGPLWRSDGLGVVGVGRSEDGSLAFRSLAPNSGAVKNLDVHLPTGTGRGNALAIRWDESHGRALVMTRGSTSDMAASSQSLKVWLVNFLSDATKGKL